MLRVVLEEVDLPVDQEKGDGLLWTAAVWHVLDKQLHLYIHRDTALQCSASPVHRDTQWPHYNVMATTPSRHRAFVFLSPYIPMVDRALPRLTLNDAIYVRVRARRVGSPRAHARA